MLITVLLLLHVSIAFLYELEVHEELNIELFITL